jgi:hypothetical protein
VHHCILWQTKQETGRSKKLSQIKRDIWIKGSYSIVPYSKKKKNNFQTKKFTLYSHAEMLQAGKCKLPFFLRVSVGSLRKRTKDILINKLKDTHEPVRKSYLTLRKC